MKKRILINLIILLALVSSSSFALTGEQVLKKVEEGISPKTAKMRFRIENRDSEKVVEYFSKKDGAKINTLFKVLKPQEEDGTAVLSLDYGSSEEMYFYIQQIGARKVASNQKKGSFFQSEYTYLEILNMKKGNYRDEFKVSLKEKKGDYFILKLEPNNSYNEYSYLLLFVNQKNYVPVKVEFYKNKKYKVWKAEELREEDGYFYAQKTVMHNLNNNRKTKITYQSVDYDTEVADMIFSVRYLRR